MRDDTDHGGLLYEVGNLEHAFSKSANVEMDAEVLLRGLFDERVVAKGVSDRVG